LEALTDRSSLPMVLLKADAVEMVQTGASVFD
jgi:hypothetical protein